MLTTKAIYRKMTVAIKQKKTKSKSPDQPQQKGSTSFPERLVPARWFFSLFGASDFDDLTGEMWV